MYVCSCMGVSDRRIEAEIRDGAATIEEIARTTGAGTRCGSCRREIEGMLRCGRNEYACRSASSTASGEGRVHLSMLPVDDAVAAE